MSSTLGNYHHDFPHLAKQSGFYFQLHKGKVNWSEIESLDVNDITENRDFQLLEQNLINVINCDLEKEYDLKILDRNFVKLFKLAQLGVDYLSYCEAYLDKCVVILQEQLVAVQEECETLKYGKENGRSDDSRSKRKNKTQTYKCEKCDKAFISDVYLKFHDKRRHNMSNTPKRQFDRNSTTRTDSWQQTEAEEKSTTSVQTTAAISQDDEDSMKIKLQHLEKIENLEREIQHLKERLRKAEDSLKEKTEAPTSSAFHSPFSGPLSHNTMLLLLPSYQMQSGSSYDEINSKFILSASENIQPNGHPVPVPPVPVAPKTVESIPPPENSCCPNTGLEKTSDKKEKDSSKGDDASGESLEELKREAKGHLECDKENIDPNASKLRKPLPPPRKSKKVIPRSPAKEDIMSAELCAAEPRSSTRVESEIESLPSQTVMTTSTPVMRKNSAVASEGSRENICELRQRESISDESLCSRKVALVEDVSTSFFKMIVGKNSPKFRKLGQNLRRSLTSLRDSVSSTGRDLIKKESKTSENAKTGVVNGLNERLRQLGVDPEWTGIPKKTMKQKLKVLKHRRKLLAKENPMYPVIRQNIEETIFHKLKKNFGSKDTNMVKKPSREALDAVEPIMQEPVPDNDAEDAKPRKCVMYDIESDSESNTSDSEVSFDGYVEPNCSALGRSGTGRESGSEPDPERVVLGKDFDLTVFQVGRKNLEKTSRKDVSVRVEELLSDSDVDGDFADEKKSRVLDSFSDVKTKNETEEISNEGFSFAKQWRSENQSIIKGTGGSQSGQQLSGKKKVWFVSNSNNGEEGLSDSPSEDNLWSLKSDWERNVG